METVQDTVGGVAVEGFLAGLAIAGKESPAVADSPIETPLWLSCDWLHSREQSGVSLVPLPDPGPGDTMAQLQFDDATSRLMEEFNASAGATRRRARLLDVLALQPGEHVLDVGPGPGHYAFEMASAVGDAGRVSGVDNAKDSIETAQRRCAGLANVSFDLGDAVDLPFAEATFDAAISTQTFEYLPDVGAALGEMFRVLKPGGRVLIHDTEWDAWVWHSRDRARMHRIMEVWDHHLADPHLPQTLGAKLTAAGFKDVGVEPLVHVETTYDPASMSAILIKFVTGYVTSQGIAESEAAAWADDLRAQGSRGDYFFSSNEYIFTGIKP
jgi:arsenite methyltransferase